MPLGLDLEVMLLPYLFARYVSVRENGHAGRLAPC